MGTSDIEVAPGHLVSHWWKLDLHDASRVDRNWQRAIAMVDARLRGRFVRPVDALIDLERHEKRKTFGFAVLAIDCLLIETIQGFRDGTVNHTRQSERLFVKFLCNWRAFVRCVPNHANASDLAKQLYIDCRCALHHTGATGSGLKVRVSGPMLNFGIARIEINRTTFHNELKREFDDYVDLLHDPTQQALRANMKTKMDYICAHGVP